MSGGSFHELAAYWRPSSSQPGSTASVRSCGAKALAERVALFSGSGRCLPFNQEERHSTDIAGRNSEASDSACAEEARDHQAGWFPHVPAFFGRNAAAARDQHQDSAGTAPSSQSQNHDGDLSAGCQCGEKSGSEPGGGRYHSGRGASAAFDTLEEGAKEDIAAINPFISWIYGGDDGARTRDLCRDRAAL